MAKRVKTSHLKATPKNKPEPTEIEDTQKKVVSSKISVGEMCVPFTIKKDICACLEKLKIQPDSLKAEMYFQFLIKNEFILINQLLSTKYKVPIFEILKKWDTTTILSNKNIR